MQLEMNPVIEPGYCYCGCGQTTPLARQTRTRVGWVKGQPLKYIHGHARSSANARTLSDADIRLIRKWSSGESDRGPMTQFEIASHFHVSRTLILLICKGERYGDVV